MRHKASCAVHDPCPSGCDCGAEDCQAMQERIEAGKKLLREQMALTNERTDELIRLRAEVDSLNVDLGLARIVVEQKQARLESTEAHIADLTQQLAAANGRVERKHAALELAHGHLLVWQTPQYQPNQNVFDTVTAALSDLPKADKEKTK